MFYQQPRECSNAESVRERLDRARLTLWQILQLLDERLRATGEITIELPHLLAAAVQHDNGGKSKNFVLLGQLHVLLFFLCGLGFSARKIELHQNEIVVREIFELGLRQNILVEFDAPPAPVRSRKIEEKKFVVRFRLFLRLVPIMQPIGFRSH
jgi:hypothetical protein